MKILIWADNHFCEAYSLVQKYGTKYSKRLENQIETLNWVEQTAVEQGCDAEICLGDFFDKPVLTDQELTALKDIQWNNLMKYFLVGNHESGEISLQYASTKALESKNKVIITEPWMTTTRDNCELCFLPYIAESIRQPLSVYVPPRTGKKRVIFSHNDISGIQMGPIISKLGFTLDEIKDNCDLYINGHLHNQNQPAENIIIAGNVTGKDLGEDANKYLHGVYILDTETLTLKFIENPHALNFYRLEISTPQDMSQLTTLKANSILSIKCLDTYVEEVKKLIAATPNSILESRLITIRSLNETEPTAKLADLTVDHLARFVECCKLNILDNTDILEAELTEVCK